ncbi:MAG: type II toxin-antitoxin system prevent-host-death family antitoxin [Acidimicrobiales bacterium]|nr:type II toxin-antitoxin system prevent-host-death family antitoxin [Acidimicrobiales bacterium]
MPIARVGIAELRDSLSRHIAAVRNGDEIIVTDHGRPVARIVPAGSSKLDTLIAEGRVVPAPNPTAYHPRPRQLGVTVSDLIER